MGKNIFDDILSGQGDVKIVEQPVEEPTDQPTDSPTDAPVDDKPDDKPIEPEKPYEIDYSAFGKKFGGDDWNEDKLKGYIEKGSKYDELVTERDSYLKRVSELEPLEGKIDPLSYFSSEDAYVREQFLLKNKDTDPSVLNVLSNLSPSKIDKLSDFEALTTKMLIDNPDIDGGKEGVTELLLDKFSLSAEELADFDNLDRATKNKIKLEAKSAKGDLKKLYEGIDVPKKADIAQSRTQIKESWEAPLKKIVEGIDKLSIAEGFDFVVTDEMKNGLFEEYLESVTNSLVRPSKETGEEIAGRLRESLVLKNLEKIVQTIRTDADEKAKAKYKEKVHNTAPLNDQTKETVQPQSVKDIINEWK